MRKIPSIQTCAVVASLTVSLLCASRLRAEETTGAAETPSPAANPVASAPVKKKAKRKAKVAPKADASPDPWAQPSKLPHATPSAAPSLAPTALPSVTPSPLPSESPDATPSLSPSPLPVTIIEPTKHVEKTPEPEEGYGKTHGLLGPVTFGPTITLLSVPHPLQVGAEVKYTDLFALTYMKGVLPKITISSNSIKMDSWDIGALWHPFRGSFFIGGTAGKQKLTGSRSQVLTGTYTSNGFSQTFSANTTLNVALDTTVYTPMLGWRWEWHSGFFYGIEFGWQFAKNATLSYSTDPVVPDQVKSTPDYQKIQADLDKAAHDYGNQGLPHFTLIQIGWLF